MTGLSPSLAGASGPSCRAVVGLGAFRTWRSHAFTRRELEQPQQPPHSSGVNFSTGGDFLALREKPWSSSCPEGTLPVCWFISKPRVGFDLDVSAEAQALPRTREQERIKPRVAEIDQIIARLLFNFFFSSPPFLFLTVEQSGCDQMVPFRSCRGSVLQKPPTCRCFGDPARSELREVARGMSPLRSTR